MVVPSGYQQLRAAVAVCHRTGFPDGETKHARTTQGSRSESKLTEPGDEKPRCADSQSHGLTTSSSFCPRGISRSEAALLFASDCQRKVFSEKIMCCLRWNILQLCTEGGWECVWGSMGQQIWVWRNQRYCSDPKRKTKVRQAVPDPCSSYFMKVLCHMYAMAIQPVPCHTYPLARSKICWLIVLEAAPTWHRRLHHQHILVFIFK